MEVLLEMALIEVRLEDERDGERMEVARNY